MTEPRRGGRLPDPGMGAICGRCDEPREAHGGPRHLGARAADSGPWDPARVLAEIEAKRRMLNHIGMVVISPGREALPSEYVEQMELFLRWLAQPYAGRDGWREEWATGV